MVSAARPLGARCCSVRVAARPVFRPQPTDACLDSATVCVVSRPSETWKGLLVTRAELPPSGATAILPRGTAEWRCSALPAALIVWLFGGRCLVRHRISTDGRPQRVLVMLTPFPTVVVKGDFGRVADQLSQRLDGAALAAIPIAGQHPMGESVATAVAGVPPLHGISIPAQLPFQR